MSEEGSGGESAMEWETESKDYEILESGIYPTKASAVIDVEFTQMDIYEETQMNIYEKLSKEMKLGSQASGNQIVTFQVQWDLLNYCQMELEEHAVLGSLLTISGTASNAYATSCKEYLTRFWPRSGWKTLRTLEAAIASEMKGTASFARKIKH